MILRPYIKRIPVVTALVFILFGSQGFANKKDGWVKLFNGKDLEGWTIKIAKHPLGKNYNDTFRAENGIMKVYYDKYKKFNMQFGHIYTNNSYSSYIFRVDYRFVGDVLADAPHWTRFNSGVMLHAQSPLTLGLTQGFPVSIEGQFLAKGASAGTQTGNVVTPGTHVELKGKLNHDHIIDSKSVLYPGDQWVTFEAEVRANEKIIYRVNGKEVLRVAHPILDDGEAQAKRLIAAGANIKLSSGHIALQAEGHPVWFRNIQLKPLND